MNSKWLMLILSLTLVACSGGGGGGGDSSSGDSSIETTIGTPDDLEELTGGKNLNESATTQCEPEVITETVIETVTETEVVTETEYIEVAPASDIEFAATPTVDEITNTSLRINWLSVTGAKAYAVFDASTDPETVISVLDESQTSFTVTGLTASTDYEFYVRAFDAQMVADGNAEKIVATTTDAPPDQLLDTISGNVLALSMKKLTNDYTGAAMRVRRDSDDLELDIGFDGYALDKAALEAHLGGANGFVVTWYDQSGGGHDASQSGPTNQPQVIIDGDNVLVRFDGDDDYLYNDSVSYTARQAYIRFSMSSTLQISSKLAQIWGSYGEHVQVAPDPRNPTITSFDGTSGGSTSAIYSLDSAPWSASFEANPTGTGWSYDTPHVMAVEYNSDVSLTEHTLGSLYPAFGVGAHQFGGDVSEVLIFSDIKTADEKLSIETH